jgi:hypothetical protein
MDDLSAHPVVYAQNCRQRPEVLYTPLEKPTQPVEESTQSVDLTFSSPDDETNYAQLYAFLCDSTQMIFPNSALLLETFNHVHNLFLRSLLHGNRSKAIFHSSYLKAYYKYRHNVFASLCRLCMGFPPTIMDTDVPLSKYIDSPKTPDMIVETDTHIKLFEFTVGNTYERVDYLKGGGSFEMKYSAECKLVQEVCKKICTVSIVPAVLESYNTVEICDILAIDYTEDFQLFFDICNENKDIISTNYIKSWSGANIPSPVIKGLPAYTRPDNMRIVLFPHDVISAISTDFGMLITRLETSPPYGKYTICFDIDLCRYRLEKSKHGKSAPEWLQIVSPDLSVLIPLLTFKQSGTTVKLSKMKGTVPVSIMATEKLDRLDVWIETTSFYSPYIKTVPQHPPTHGEPAFFDDSMLVVPDELSKVAFPPDYFARLCSMDIKPIMDSKSSKLLYNCKMTPVQADEAVDLFEHKMGIVNNVDTLRAKPTFLLGILSTPHKLVPLTVDGNICQAYTICGSGDYTKEILRKASQGLFATSKKNEFSTQVREIFDEYHRANSAYHGKVIQTSGTICSRKKMEDDVKKATQSEYDLMCSSRKAYISLLGKSKTVVSDRLVRVNCRGNMKSFFEKEMTHYNRFEGVSGLGLWKNHEQLQKYFPGLLTRMIAPGFLASPLDTPYDTATNTGSHFLFQLKETHQQRWSLVWDKLKDTMLMLNCLFHERLANFLFNESVKAYNYNYVKVDNLGLSDILIMCRGGSKIFKHQRSRLYRLFFPISSQDLQFSGYMHNDSFEILRYSGRVYIATPWSQVHQDVLFDYMFCTYRVFNQIYSITSRVDSSLTHPIPSLAIFPALLMFHNRRKTEKFLHNSRYLIVNPLGSSANLAGIIESFADTNYTWIDVWLRGRISISYKLFASQMMLLRDKNSRRIDLLLDEIMLRDLWLDEPIISPDLLTLFIYSTYMMTKAPVNSSLEQASNLWEILADINLFSSTHPDVQGMDDISLRMDVLKFDVKMYDDDFKYDPVFCQYLGHYMSNYLSGSITPSELSNKWDAVVNEDFDRMANSNGLRGTNQKNFFGKKGYEVVYDKVNEMLKDEDIISRIEGYLEMSHQTAASAIQADRITISSLDSKFEDLIFHVVHKIQRGGGREIFCMDLNTKSLQNPIENFFAFMCKRVPNEFISIPSGRRHAKIHADFYEKNISKWVKKVVRWVLDCRRWAPHSVFQKYVHFIIGMSHILPQGFLKHFYQFAEGMFKKKFVTREHVLSKMRNNKRFDPFKQCFTALDRAADAIAMSVQFSFVMGIFNYLSTLMHAANQLVASEVIRQQSLSNGYGLVVLDAKCHSDDSVVSSYHEDEQSVQLSVKLYDWLLKGANHMLSIKKSQINNDVYLEFLSTLYLFDRFLPVFPKFISTIPFKPTDEGFNSDITFAVSQAIEMLTMGGTLEESYLIMKTTDKAIRKIYNIKTIEGLPPQLFGPLDSHPIELLFCGSNADLYNFYTYNKEKFWKVYGSLEAHGILDLTEPTFSLKWDMGSHVANNIKRKLEHLQPIIDKLSIAEWTLQNNKMGNSTLNLIWYYLKLSDRKFRSSLIDEPVSRRMSRIFGSANYRMIRTKTNLVPVAAILALLQEGVVDETLCSLPTETENYITFMSRELKEFHDSLDNTTIVTQEPSNIKEKPVVFITSSVRLGSGNLSAAEYVSYKKEPDGYKLLGKFRNPAREVLKIDQELSILGVDSGSMSAPLLYQISRKVLGQEMHTFRMVSAVPSGTRVLSNYSQYLTYLETNSMAHTRLRLKNTAAASVDWRKKLTAGKIPQVAKDYVQLWWTCTLLSDNGILDKDLYIQDMRALEKQAADLLPEEWKLILLTSVEQRNSPLSDINHWIYWEKEQLKMGTMWVGSGACVVKLPEATVRLEMSGGTCKLIQIFTNHSGFFSQSSSWYLHNVLNNSAVSAQYFDPVLANPNTKYLGISSNSSMYGIGRANAYSLVIEVQWVDREPFPSEFYQTLPYDKKRNHFSYKGKLRDYYIDFFVPVEDPIKITLRGVFDLEKVRQHANDPIVVDFVKKVAIDVGGLMDIDKDYFINNLGSSTLYNMLYDSPARSEIIANKVAEPCLALTFESWKKTHEHFGYPTEEELTSLLRDSDSPPFPRNIMTHLLRAGKSNLSEIEFQTIIMQISRLKGEDRLMYLTSQLGFMDDSMKIASLVVAARSRLVYKTTYVIGIDSLRLLVPYIITFATMLDNNKLNVPTLNNIKNTLYHSKRVKLSIGEIFRTIGAKVLYDTYVTEANMSRLNSMELFVRALREAYYVGAGLYMNATPTSDPLIRTIDFDVPFVDLHNFVDDLVAGVQYYRSKIRPASSAMKMFAKIPDAAAPLNEMKALILRFNCFNSQQSLTFHTKNRQWSLKSTEPLWGDVVNVMQPYDEENREELRCNLEMGDYEEIEYLDPDEDADLPEYAFVNIFEGNFLTIASGRGSAWNVFYKCARIDNSIRNICSEQVVKVFKKTGGFYNLHTYLESNESYIVYVGNQNIHCTIPNYHELNFELLVKELRPIYTYERIYHLNDAEVSRSELKENPEWQVEILEFDSYFKEIKRSTLNEAEKEIEQAAKYLPEYKNDAFDKVLRKIKRLKNEEVVEEMVEIDFSTIHTQYQEAMIKEVSKRGEPLKEHIRVNYSNFYFSEPVRLLTDILVRSEFNTLFPGQLDSILNSEIRLSARTKQRIIKFAQMTIQNIPRRNRKIYSKLLYVVKCVLCDVQECNFNQNESLEFAAIIDSMFQDAEDTSSSEENINDLIPDNIEDLVKFDLSKIFQ